MRRLYTSADGVWVGYLRALLDAEGIAGVVKNGFLSSAMGELPPHECWPELWVAEEDYAAAERLLASATATVPGAPWRCAGCGESVDGELGVCWSCGRAAPD